MTQKEVEAILGPGDMLDRTELATLTADTANNKGIANEYAKYWGPWVDKGLVHKWRNGTEYIMVAYNDPPGSGGKLKGLNYRTMKNGMLLINERIKLPRNPSADPDAVRHGIATGSAGQEKPSTEDKTPVATLTVPEFIKDHEKYKDKWVVVKGTIWLIVEFGGRSANVVFDRVEGSKLTARGALERGVWKQGLIAEGDSVELKGKVAGVTGSDLQGGQFLDLLECELVKRTPKGEDKTPAATLTADDLARDHGKYKDKWVVVTGLVQNGMELSMEWQNVVMVQNGGKPLSFRVPPGKDQLKSVLIVKGDSVEIKGKLAGLTPSGAYVQLVNCELVKRTPKGDAPKTEVPKPDPVIPVAGDKPIEVTVADLLDEYIKDQKAAEEKYRNKVLKVTGEVKQTTAAAIQFVGKTAGGTTHIVSATLPPDGRAGLADLKTGDKATVTGKVGPFTTRTSTKTSTLVLREAQLVK